MLFTGYQTPEYESLMTRAAAHFAQETGEESEEDEEDEAALPTFDAEEEAAFAEAYESAAEDAPLVLPDEETETL